MHFRHRAGSVPCAAIAGIVAALGNIVLAATGEQGWGEALVSIAFAALGCVGLGGARGILGALKGGAKFLTAGKLGELGGLKGLVTGTGIAFKEAFARGAQGLQGLARFTGGMKGVGAVLIGLPRFTNPQAALAVARLVKPRGAVSMLEIAGRRFVGISGTINKAERFSPLDDVLQGITDAGAVLPGYSGFCAEIRAINDALKVGVTDFSQAVIRTFDIPTRAYKPPCTNTCKVVLEEFGIGVVKF